MTAPMRFSTHTTFIPNDQIATLDSICGAQAYSTGRRVYYRKRGWFGWWVYEPDFTHGRAGFWLSIRLTALKMVGRPM